jgi:hypothetical protein
MVQRTLPGLGLTGFWPLGFDGWKDGMDANLRLLSAVAARRVLSRTTTLPGSPTTGAVYIVPSGAGTNPNKVAIWDGEPGAEAWVYLTPNIGLAFHVVDSGENVQYQNTGWVVPVVLGAYDLSFFIAGKTTDLETVGRVVATRAFSIPISATGSQAKAGTASAADKSFSLQKNGAAFGTVRFNISGTGAFTVAAATSFAIGDALGIVAPAVADTTLADTSIVLKAQLL